MRLGLDLADLGGSLSYRRLKVILSNSARDSAYAISVNEENAAWSLENHLLAGILDVLKLANWQRSGDRGIPKPNPVPRPGVETSKKGNGKRIGGGKVVPFDVLDRILLKKNEV